MIEIVTSDGIYLDIAPETEFTLEMENPLFGSDSIVSAFSTQIIFPSTEVNRKVFGWPDAMMLPPSVKSIDASIFFDGIVLMEGTLKYESIEDRELNYTFTANTLDSRFQQKICDVPINVGGVSRYASVDDMLEAIREDQEPGVHMPVIVDQAETETVENWGSTTTDVAARKYINYPFAPLPGDLRTMPVIDVMHILRYGSFLFERDTVIAQKATSLSIVGQYILSADKLSDTVFTRTEGYFDFATYLPDITFLELLNILCGIFAARIYQDGSTYRMIRTDAVLSGTVVDLSHKVFDTYSSGIEVGKKYIIGYAGNVSNDYNIDHLEDDIADGDVDVLLASWSVLFCPTDSNDRIRDSQYHIAYHQGSGQCYSFRLPEPNFYSSGGLSVLIDTIYRPAVDHSIGSSEEDKEEVRIQAAPVKCAPVSLPAFLESDGSYREWWPGGNYLRVAPIVTIPDKADRGKDVLIGCYGSRQLSDCGMIMDPEDQSDAVIPDGLSLSTDDLFEAYHKRLAEWLAIDRQTVTIGLSLTTEDVASWRLFHRFYFQSRMWICKKLSVTFRSGSSSFEAEGEFVEL